jgi:hypothetical protein
MQPLLDEHQVAELLNRPVKTLRHNRSTGKGPLYLKLGRTVRYRPEDIRSYLKECEGTPRITRRIRTPPTPPPDARR